MDEIQTRLTEATDNCLKAYGVWVDKKKDSDAQEGLSSAIHELRKVSSRLEIELAISEREQMTSKPLPIPSHRANAKKGAAIADHSDFDPKDQQPKSNVQSMPKRRRSPRNNGPKPAAAGNKKTD